MVYLNQAATTYPKPKRVLEAHAAALCAPPEGQFRDGSTWGGEVFDRCRENLGRLLGIADAGRIVFASGATDAASAMTASASAAQRRSLMRPHPRTGRPASRV